MVQAAKIALCLSGHYRTFDVVYPSIKTHFMDAYGINNEDVFIHTWSNDGLRTDLGKSLSPSNLANAQFSNGLVDVERFQKFDLTNNLVIEEYHEVEKREKFRETIQPIKQEFLRRNMGDRRMVWLVSQYYKRLKCLEMVLNLPKIYDLVIATRLDFCPKHFPPGFRGRKASESVKLDLLPSLDDIIYLTLLDNNIYHDFYMIGKPKVVYECCKIAQNLSEIDKHFRVTGYENMSCGHAVLTYFVRSCGVKIENIDLLGYIER